MEMGMKRRLSFQLT